MSSQISDGAKCSARPAKNRMRTIAIGYGSRVPSNARNQLVVRAGIAGDGGGDRGVIGIDVDLIAVDVDRDLVVGGGERPVAQVAQVDRAEHRVDSDTRAL